MTPRFAFMAALRESRGGAVRLTFFCACLAVGVAAVTAVSTLVSSVEASIRARSRDLLGADIAVEARRPLPAELATFLPAGNGIERTDLVEMATMAAGPRVDGRRGGSRLVELKVVDGAFPFYGELVLEPRGDLHEVLDADTCVAAPELLDALGVEVGGSLLLGGKLFRVGATVLAEPDRLDISLVLGPRVFLSTEGLERAGLTGFGNRVKHRALFKVPEGAGDVAAIKETLESDMPGAVFLRIETHRDAQPALRRSLDRIEEFLGLIALLSLLLGGIGVAQVVRAWVTSRTPAIAVLRCIGFRPRDVLIVFLIQVGVLSLLASASGAALGALLAYLAPSVAPGLVPGGVETVFDFGSAILGMGLGLGIAAVFSLLPLTAVWRVSPARVLRAEAEPLSVPWVVRIVATVVLLTGIFLAAWVQSGDASRAGWFTVGVVVVALALAGVARLTMALVGRLPRSGMGPYWRHGFAALARPGAGTVGAVVALGLGVMVVFSVWIVERNLRSGIEDAIPDEAPSAFLMDIQPEQWEGVRASLEKSGAEDIESVPVVMARFSSVDGKDVDALLEEKGRGRVKWILTREQRLTWMAELPEDNEIVEGELWSRPEVAEVSLEKKYARDLGAEIGSILVLDIHGVEVELVVTSIRTVVWQSFGINFFLVVEPGVLDDAPHFRLAALRFDGDGTDEAAAQDRLAEAFPNVTMIRISSIIGKVVVILERIVQGIRLLGSFTILAGLTILAGAIAATSARRTRETALLKVLGLTRLGVAWLLGLEFALVGLLAGSVGACSALGLAYLFLDVVVELPFSIPWAAALAVAFGTALASAVCGVATSIRALLVRPAAGLR